MANSHSSSGASSDWWIWGILAIAVGVCPPIGILIMIITFLVKWLKEDKNMAGLNFFNKMFDFEYDGKLRAFETRAK